MDCIYLTDHQYGVSVVDPGTLNSFINGDAESEGIKRKRKREKLDHLTEKEKLLRRKIKNRISAQTSRDKKKRIMSSLEIELNSINEDNKRLIQENINLKTRLDKSESNQLRISTLEMENKFLKDKLEMLEKMIMDNQKSPSPNFDINSMESESERSVDTSFEPAVPINGSQQKNQEVNKEILMIWTMLLIISLIVMVKISSHGYHLFPVNYLKTKLNNLYLYSLMNKIQITHNQMDQMSKPKLFSIN